jgi:DNA-binding response OmpR family regulator
MMPGMSGLEVCRELRKDPATAADPGHPPDGLAQEADIAAGFAAGADDYIVKPFSPRDFATRVSAVLARVRAGLAGPGRSAACRQTASPFSENDDSRRAANASAMQVTAHARCSASGARAGLRYARRSWRSRVRTGRPTARHHRQHHEQRVVDH